MIAPRCKYHPAIEMQRVKNQPKRKGNWVARFAKDEYERYACPISGCPFVMAIEKPTPVPKPKVRKQAMYKTNPFNPSRW